jgi:hypothetical protein
MSPMTERYLEYLPASDFLLKYKLPQDESLDAISVLRVNKSFIYDN